LRSRIRKCCKICIASGIILAQVSTLGAFSPTAYAMTDQKSELKNTEKVETVGGNQQIELVGNQKVSQTQLTEVKHAVINSDSVAKLSCFKDAMTEVVPADNTFIARFTPKTKVIVTDGIRTKYGNLVVDKSKKTGSVTFTNIGYYKGKSVTLKVSLQTQSPAESWIHIDKDSPGFLDVKLGDQVDGSKSSVDIEYSFFDEEGNPLPVKTTLNYRGVNRAKYFSIHNFDQMVENVYTLKTSPIRYDIQDNGTYRFYSSVKDWHGDPQKLTLTTREITHLKMNLENRESSESEVMYLTEFFPRVEMPKVEARNQVFQVANDPNVSAEFMQTIPYLNKDRHMKHLSYIVTAETGNQYVNTKWIVKDIWDKDWTTGFTFTKNAYGTTITAKPETLNNQAFYDNVYFLKEVYSFVGSESAPVDKKKLTPKNEYPIHFELSQSVDENSSYAKTSGTTLINYMGQVQVQHIDQETKQLIPNVQDAMVEGIITDPFHVNPIPIPGYQVVKNQPITGIFLPEKQMLSHLYTPVKATLEANDFSTVIGNIPTDQEEIKKFILKEAKVKATELPNNTDITNQVEVVDIGELRNQIGSYVVILKVKGVEKTITVHVIEGSLELISVPKNISFEAIKIPSQERVFNRNSDQGEIVVSDKRENRREWDLYVKQMKPLTSYENDVLPDALVYTKNGIDVALNNRNYLVHSQISPDYQSVHVKWKGTDGIRLKIQPGPNVKTNTKYQGELEWTLTDAPI